MMVSGWVFSLLILGRIVWGGYRTDTYKLFGEYHVSRDLDTLQAACSLDCSDEPCIRNCIRTKHIKGLDQGAKADVRLACRDESYFVLAHNPGLFVTGCKRKTTIEGQVFGTCSATVSNGTNSVIYQLGPDYIYQCRIHRLSTSGISMPETTAWIHLFSHAYRPMNVTNITIGKFKRDKHTSPRFTAEISFTPSEDRPCYYEVRCQQIDGKYDHKIYMTYEKDFSLLRTTFKGLHLAENFTVTIKSLTEVLRWDATNDVEGTIATFSTPRCVPHYNHECVPEDVKGLSATATHKTGNIFDVFVTWRLDVSSSVQDALRFIIYLNSTGGGIEHRVFDDVAELKGKRTIIFRDVKIEDQYDVYIRGKNRFGRGSPTSRRFTTGLKRIAAVEGLNATAIPNKNKTFDIRVTWDSPEVTPAFYIVSVILNGSEIDHQVVHNISGSANDTVFSGVQISDEFDVSVTPWFPRARSGPKIKQRFKKPRTDNSRRDVPEDIRMPIYLSVSILTTVIGIAAYGYYTLRKRRLNKRVPAVDAFEMNPERLTITRVLGTGAFGVVKFASLRDHEGNVTNVAVKMLQDDSNENDRRNFLQEIEIMKTMDEHPNIICLLGCNTTGLYPFMVIEYCSRGDLQSFLKKSLEEASTLVESKAMKRIVPTFRTPKRKEILQANSRSLPVFRNRDNYVQAGSCPDEQDITNSDSEVVTAMEMLNFGRQIARGMEFLSSNRVVHRDLAARNILVCCDRTVKISDFGLSRDIYKENIYKKTENGRMPFKWMAIEAMTHQIYTTYSDVWSFGILLWEIVSRGGEPYPGVPTMEILNHLQSGYRMPQPANCSIPLYNVMLSCWKTRPKDRPTFTILRQELDKLICSAMESEYFDLDDILEETRPEGDDSQPSSSHLSSQPTQVVIVNDLESPIVTVVPEGSTEELEMS